MSIDFNAVNIGERPKILDSDEEPESNESGDGSSSSSVMEFEEKKLEYTNNKQTVSIGHRMKSALPIQLKKIDPELDWIFDHQLPRGLSLNEHTGTIHGRVTEDAKLGPFDTCIYAESHKVKWVASFSITIVCIPIERIIYPNGSISMFTRGVKIKTPIKPRIIGSIPEHFSIAACKPYKVRTRKSKKKEKADGDGDEAEDASKPTENPLETLGLTFDPKTGGFAGCPSVLGKSSWIVTARNPSGSVESDVVVLDVRRDPDELGPPKEHFSIPQQSFSAMDLKTSCKVFGGNESGRFVLDQVGNILRACGKTPTPKEVKVVFDKYSGGKPYVTMEHLKQMMKFKFHEINLKEIEQIFSGIDNSGRGTISMGQLRKILSEGVGVKESVIQDISNSLDVTGSGDNAQLDWMKLLDLFSRVSSGVGYGNYGKDSD